MITLAEDYESFIAEKLRTRTHSGFSPGALLKSLFPFQDFIVRRALVAGRYAIFADCGLGKTLMQLVWAYEVYRFTGKPILILAPLAVTWQTLEEAAKFGIPLDGITVTNYEQIDNLDPNLYAGIVLDESSILKSFDGATKKKLVDSFDQTPYKLACTATPSPNDPEELGNHAEFLNVMTRAEMLAMYFVHDAGDTGEWRIKGHAVKHFWEFVASWAVMLRSPADIGFDSTGYDLPPLNLIEHKIHTPNKGDGQLFNDTAVNATDFNAELRRTKKERLEKAADIINGSTESFLTIIKQNEEGEELRRLVPGSVEVTGSDSPEEKAARLKDFSHDKYRVLVSKNKIIQFGLNFQNSHNIVVASLDFSFEGLYQVIRREWRFGQKHAVNVHIITTDTMSNVIEAIREKQRKFEEMQTAMSEAMNASLNKTQMTESVYDTDDVKNDHYHIRRGDCVRLIRDVPDNSVGFSVFSPPFADLFTYSSHVEDMGNTKDFDQFVVQFKFLVRELFRVIKPGRNVAVHCMDIPTQKGRHGHIGIRDFSGMIREAFEEAGFIYHSRVTIWKDPVTAMQRTKALGLLHKQIRKDSTMSRVGIPDNVLIFRKDGERDDPVWHYGTYNEAVNAIKGKDLDDEAKAIELSRVFDVELWQKYASPVWMDIDQGDTLNFRIAREEEDEKHLCPLQLGVIKRLIFLYTNPGDVVYSPFGGIGSEPYTAVEMGRFGLAHELKEAYYGQMKTNMAAIVEDKKQGDLF
jgi:DNA modification methylase